MKRKFAYISSVSKTKFYLFTGTFIAKTKVQIVLLKLSGQSNHSLVQFGKTTIDLDRTSRETGGRLQSNILQSSSSSTPGGKQRKCADAANQTDWKLVRMRTEMQREHLAAYIVPLGKYISDKLKGGFHNLHSYSVVQYCTGLLSGFIWNLICNVTEKKLNSI